MALQQAAPPDAFFFLSCNVTLPLQVAGVSVVPPRPVDVTHLAVSPGADAARADLVQSAWLQVVEGVLGSRSTVRHFPLIPCERRLASKFMLSVNTWLQQPVSIRTLL